MGIDQDTPDLFDYQILVIHRDCRWNVGMEAAIKKRRPCRVDFIVDVHNGDWNHACPDTMNVLPWLRCAFLQPDGVVAMMQRGTIDSMKQLGGVWTGEDNSGHLKLFAGFPKGGGRRRLATSCDAQGGFVLRLTWPETNHDSGRPVWIYTQESGEGWEQSSYSAGVTLMSSGITDHWIDPLRPLFRRRITAGQTITITKET